VLNPDIQALLDRVAGDLGAAISLADPDDRLLAYTVHDEPIDEVRREVLMHRRTSSEAFAWFLQWGIRDATSPVRTPPDQGLGIFARWCIPVRFRGRLMGYPWILDTRGIAESELGAAVEAVEHISGLLFRQELSRRVDNDLVRLLVIPSQDNENAADEARALGSYAHNGPIAVVAAGSIDGNELSPSGLGDLTLAVQRAAGQSTPEALCGVISGLGVLLAPLRKRTDLGPARNLAERVCQLAGRLNNRLTVVAGVGGAAELERASRSYAEARRALRMTRAMPHFRPIASWDDLGVFRALALVPAGEAESGVIDSRVQALLADPALAATAETFLDLAGDVQKTAARLFVHRTTLYQRLDRISEVYRLDLRRSGDHRLVTHLGLKLAHLTASNRPPGP